MVTLYLGRHGTTKLNSEEKLRGWIDVGLNKEGVREAEAMAKAMQKTDIERLYSSDLDRADHTAQIVGQYHGLKPIKRSWFRPINYGELEGKLLKDIKPRLQDLNNIWKKDPTYEAPGGESFQEFQDRNLQGLQAILDTAMDETEVMLIAHLRNTLLIHGVATTGGPLEGERVQMMDGKHWSQEPGSVSRLEYDQSEQRLYFRGMFFDPQPATKMGMVS